MNKFFFSLMVIGATFGYAVEELPPLPAPGAAPLKPLEVKPPPPKTFSFNVVLEPLYMTIVNSEVTSPVLKVHKRMGESFLEGEVLVDIDSRVFQGNFEKAVSLVTRYESELAAKRQLYADDALSEFELNEAIAALTGAEAELILAKKMLDDTQVKAPYNGKVVKVTTKEFELAQSGRELISLVNDEKLYAKFLIPSSLVSCVKKGMLVDIIIKETGDHLKTNVTRVAPVIDPSSATIMVEAEIDNRIYKLWPGMTGKVTLKACEPESNKTTTKPNE